MTKYKLISELQKNGMMQKYYNCGILGLCVIDHFTVYEHYLVELNLRKNKSQAIYGTARSCKKDQRTIWSIVKSMETEI
jgi:hypothetical protein